MCETEKRVILGHVFNFECVIFIYCVARILARNSVCK